MNRLLAICACLALLGASASARQKKTPDAEYREAVEQVKRSDPAVDFRALRTLATRTSTYSASGGSNQGETFAALRSGDFKKALELARKDLGENYLDVDAHMAAMMALGELGDAKASEHHRYVVRGIVDSILKSGDGKSPATAFHVITVSEEYALLRVLGLALKSQGLRHIDGHSYDVLTVVDPESKREMDLFFNIDPIWAYQTKLFSK